uniref:Uncharacterized protein n=1 Tax=Glossina austeni TaxID=7395 RepID=A0A1A9UY49_GLOAU
MYFHTLVEDHADSDVHSNETRVVFRVSYCHVLAMSDIYSSTECARYNDKNIYHLWEPRGSASTQLEGDFADNLNCARSASVADSSLNDAITSSCGSMREWQLRELIGAARLLVIYYRILAILLSMLWVSVFEVGLESEVEEEIGVKKASIEYKYRANSTLRGQPVV